MFSLRARFDDGKEHVAEFFTHVRIFVHEFSGLRARVGKFAQFFGELLGDVAHVDPIESDARRFLLHLLSALQRRHAARNTIELRGSRRARRFLRFELIQFCHTSATLRYRDVAENVRMPANHFVRERIDHVGH